MPIVKKCTSCGITLLFPTMQDNRCFCSAECQTLYEDPDILEKMIVVPPSEVRKDAVIWFLTSFAGWISLFWYRRNTMSYLAALIPMFFLVELVTGMTIEHATLRFQALAEWKRALLMAALFLGALGAMAGGVYWYVVTSPRF